MDIQFCPSPTVAEAKALASLPSATPLNCERVHEVLEEILAFCRRPDVNGFLFTPEPIQASYFLKPSVLDGAFTCTLLSTRVEPGKQLDNTQVTDHLTGSAVLFPAFVSQNLSFGFAVNNIIYSPANTWGAETGFSYNSEVRYVRDNDKRILLSLADSEEVGVMQFQYTRQISTTSQFRVVACFVRKDFKAVVVKNHYDVNDLLGAMFHIQTGVEYRTCPLCRAGHGECPCDLPNYKPKHPFDREMVRRNIQMHLGSFEGSANVAFLNKGRFSESASVGSRMTLQGKLDRELAERLRRWVLKKHSRLQSPWQSCFFTNDEQRENAGLLFSTDVAKTETGAAELLKTLGISSQMAGGFLSPYDSYGYLSELLAGMEAGDREVSDATSVLTNPARIISALQDTSVQPSTELVQRNAGQMLKKGTLRLPTHSKQSAKDESNWDEIQRRKEERRKEQNRMSARKSNQKKKAFNDALKRSLKETHERAALLRGQELQLRRENLELRKRLEEQ